MSARVPQGPIHSHFITAPSHGALQEKSAAQQGIVKRPGPPHSASAFAQVCSASHFMTAPSHGALQEESAAQQGIVKRPGPPHSASAFAQVCSASHFIVPSPPRSVSQRALPQQLCCCCPGPPHTWPTGAQLGSGCSSTHCIVPSPPSRGSHFAVPSRVPQHSFGSLHGPPQMPPGCSHHLAAKDSKKPCVEFCTVDSFAWPRKFESTTSSARQKLGAQLTTTAPKTLDRQKFMVATKR